MTSSEKVSVALVKGGDRRENVRRALELIREDVAPKVKGMVMVKPNFLSVTRQLASTHVDAVRGVLDFLMEVQLTSAIIAEGASGDTLAGYRNFGYLPLEREYPVSLIDLLREKGWEQIELLDTEGRKISAWISRLAVECPCRISVAVPKTHNTAVITLSLKNMMGCLAPGERGKMHGLPKNTSTQEFVKSVKVMHKNLITLARYVAPHISVIDGFTGMEGNGPGSGDEVRLGWAIASADFVAADAVGAKAMGFEPLEIGYIWYADQLGFGVGDLERIEVIGARIEEVRHPFKPHPNYPHERLWRET